MAEKKIIFIYCHNYISSKISKDHRSINRKTFFFQLIPREVNLNNTIKIFIGQTIIR